MSQQDYENKLAAIQAVSEADVATPNIPISVAVQEAENLYYWCQPDKDKLVAAGLNWELVDDLPARAAACRYAQSVWNKDHQSVEDAQKEWKEKSPAAFDLRDELLHHFFFAYRNAPDVYSKVNTIAEGNGKATEADRRRYFEIARGSAFECAAIQDVLEVCGAMASGENARRKDLLDRIAAMLTKLGRRGYSIAEDEGGYSPE